jgi:predicted DNA-binding transcriptional regulator YafY
MGAVAARLGVSQKELTDDIATLTLLGDQAIESSWLLSLRISQQDDQLSVTSAGPFQRPVRLSPEEQLAIQLALALDPKGEALAARLAGLWSGKGPSAHSSGAGEGSHDSVIDKLRYAVRERLVVEIAYAGEGEREIRTRTIHPYQVAELGISTYIAAWANDVQAWRNFRLDRIVSITLTTVSFIPRDDFVPMTRPRDSFRPSTAVERVTVRFRPAVSAWVTEFFPEHEVLADGSVLVRFSAASPDWLIRRVLEFGADAEVVEPPRYRDAVRRAIA